MLGYMDDASVTLILE